MLGAIVLLLEAGDLGEWYVGRGEFFRAAGVYLEQLHEAESNAAARATAARLYHVYERAGQLQLALDLVAEGAAAGWVTESGATWGAYSLQVRLGSGIAPPPPGATSLARLWFESLGRIRSSDVDGSRARLSEIAARCQEDKSICNLARRNLALFDAPPESPDPLFAGALAAVVPGAGHFYAGHGVDGVLYATLTMSLGLIAWDIADSGRGMYDQKTSFYVVGAAGILMHATSVLSAANSALRQRLVATARWNDNLLLGPHPSLNPFAGEE
jgi:TM2 domain-containing membrane protein YozV